MAFRTGHILEPLLPSRDAQFTDELAVMIDTFRPLKLTKMAVDLDDPNYPYS